MISHMYIYIYISICLNIPKLLLRKHWKPPTGQPMPFLALWMTVSFQMKFQWPEKWMAMTLICNSIAGVLRISCWPYWDILRSLTASNSTSCFFHHPGKLHPKKNNKQTKQLWIFCLKKTNWKAEKKKHGTTEEVTCHSIKWQHSTCPGSSWVQRWMSQVAGSSCSLLR